MASTRTGGGRAPFTVPAQVSDEGMLVPALYAVADDAYSRRQEVREACRDRVPGLGRSMVLIVADRDVSHRSLVRALFTLGQARFSTFAFLVVDPQPEDSREGTPLAGLRGHFDLPWGLQEDSELVGGTVVAGGRQTRWHRGHQPGQAVSLPETGPLPKDLGEAIPPNVTMVMAPGSSTEGLLAMQDRLAGAGVYCVWPASGVPSSVEVESVAPSLPPMRDRRSVRVPSQEVLAVHVVEFPGMGAIELQRLDGARCSALVQEVKAPSEEGETPPVRDGLE